MSADDVEKFLKQQKIWRNASPVLQTLTMSGRTSKHEVHSFPRARCPCQTLINGALFLFDRDQGGPLQPGTFFIQVPGLRHGGLQDAPSF